MVASILLPDSLAVFEEESYCWKSPRDNVLREAFCQQLAKNLIFSILNIPLRTKSYQQPFKRDWKWICHSVVC